MPLVRISLLKGKSKQHIRAISEGVHQALVDTADRLAERPGLRREDVQVILSSNARDEWSFGNGLASYVKEPKPN